MTTKILKRALEMAVQMFIENTAGCRDCPLYDFVNIGDCTKTDCHNDILQFIKSKATAEIKAKGEKI